METFKGAEGNREITTGAVSRILGHGRSDKYSRATLALIRSAVDESGCRNGSGHQAGNGARVAAGMLMDLLRVGSGNKGIQTALWAA